MLGLPTCVGLKEGPLGNMEVRHMMGNKEKEMKRTGPTQGLQSSQHFSRVLDPMSHVNNEGY